MMGLVVSTNKLHVEHIQALHKQPVEPQPLRRVLAVGK